jgi:hypothetical protein
MATNPTVAHHIGSEQQWLATLSLPPTVSLPSAYALNVIPFDKFTGGDVTATVNKHRPAGMGPEVTYLSLPSYSDVTLTKVYNTDVDHALIGTLHTFVGNTIVTVNLTPLDDEGNVFNSGASNTNGFNAGGAQGRTYSGRIIAIKDGGTDSTSNAVRMWEIDIAVETIAN